MPYGGHPFTRLAVPVFKTDICVKKPTNSFESHEFGTLDRFNVHCTHGKVASNLWTQNEQPKECDEI
jgi:hypothetical protein